MENDDRIEVSLLCTYYRVEPSFFDLLGDYGLIDYIMVEDVRYLESQRLKDLERMIHLHYDLDINMEGIDTIQHLLQRVNVLQEELNMLKNKIRFLEIQQG